MKVAVLSDIHSNYIALEKCMNYAVGQGVKDFLFLGDYIGELAYPEKTMELLERYRERYHCVFVRGNKEGYWLNYKKIGEQGWSEYHSTTGALYYAYHHLTEEHLNFFEGLPIATGVKFEGLPELMLCHGSPFSTKEKMILNQGTTLDVLDRCGAAYLLCGHTHIQGTLRNRYRVVLNPGSVGLALQAGGRAEFAILHGDNGVWKEELVSLDYDRERAVRELHTSGLSQRAPYWCMITENLLLRNSAGEVGHAEVLCHAMDLCRKDTGVCNWPDIPEKYWEQAVREFGLCV